MILLSGLCFAETMVVLISWCFGSAEAQLELPPCIHEDRWVPLSGVERAMYDSLRKRLDNAVDPMRSASSRARRRQSDLRTSK